MFETSRAGCTESVSVYLHLNHFTVFDFAGPILEKDWSKFFPRVRNMTWIFTEEDLKYEKYYPWTVPISSCIINMRRLEHVVASMVCHFESECLTNISIPLGVNPKCHKFKLYCILLIWSFFYVSIFSLYPLLSPFFIFSH